eukprot:GEMP01089777.1.p1 GENE.GEMP01089777.1~~GEMP01089777.1.p1  ORF type:complete len:110 (-),score=0.98 GEMP01089777.1:107-436(-)
MRYDNNTECKRTAVTSYYHIQNTQRYILNLFARSNTLRHIPTAISNHKKNAKVFWGCFKEVLFFFLVTQQKIERPHFSASLSRWWNTKMRIVIRGLCSSSPSVSSSSAL